MPRFPIYETEDAFLDGEISAGCMFLHVEVKAEKFTKSMYKEFLAIWVEVMEQLKQKGIDFVYSCIPKDKKILKWQQMFGLSPIAEVGEYYLCRREL